MKEYTAIYTEGWTTGSHYHTSVHMKRIVQQDNETLADCLVREGIDQTTQFLFEGHPKLQGE